MADAQKQTLSTPEGGPEGEPEKLQTESHLKDDLCDMVWSQTGVSSESPRPCRKFVWRIHTV